jgi:radical SAM/Cys-rich protein
MKSLNVINSPLSQADHQLQVLHEALDQRYSLPAFSEKLQDSGIFPIRALYPEILQVNLGKMCNQVCKHCHVDAGPDRKEIMTWDTMEHCLSALREHPFQTLDLTGGAPEMNPHFFDFVQAVRQEHPDLEILVRCNLTIIVSNKKYHSLPDFFRSNRITVISSLPYFEESKTDRQRGEGVFAKSIQALKMLNEAGYGQDGSGQLLHLVYNPAGAFLPGSQDELKRRFKEVLWSKYQIRFNDLYAITNLPISRFLSYLVESGNLRTYMEKLVQAFNPQTVPGLMCRNTLSVGWDGKLYDCDFNQMLEIPVELPSVRHIRDFNPEALRHRNIAIDTHCYGCTAGSGSSCGGATVSSNPLT